MTPDILRNLKPRTRALRAIRAFPGGDSLIETYQRRRRMRSARTFLGCDRLFPDAREAILADFDAVCLHTQLGMAGICNLEALARDVIARGVAGSFVECGTWRGGALAYWARSFLRNGGKPGQSPIFGFDSFEGMPQMTSKDGEFAARWLHGRSIEELSPDLLSGTLTSTGANVASELDCRDVVARTGFPEAKTAIVKGWFQDTLAAHKSTIGAIAVLRLDGDWYESTRCCLVTLFDQVVPGGAVVIDDYGTFAGCRRAVDEFLSERAIRTPLMYVDSSVRYFYKP
jgi:hypothetical protein